MIGRMRSRFGATRLRASRTKLRGNERFCRDGRPQTWARAHDVERRTAGANELVGRRSKLTGVDPRDRPAQLRLELRQLRAVERGRNDRVGPLEEVVDDLDLLGAGAEAGERVDESLKPVVVVDDF